MKAKVKYLLGASMIFLLAGCAGSAKPDNASSEPYDAGSRGESVSGDYYTPSYREDSSSSKKNTDTANQGSTQNNNLPRAGQLTCSAIDDNSNYTYWKDLCFPNQSQGRYGITEFGSYVNSYDFDTKNRLELNIINGKNIKVSIKDTQDQVYVDNFHKAYLFPKTVAANYDVEISYVDSNNQNQTVEKNVKDGDIVDLQQTFTTNNNMQIMFVIDATGSMGDELTYLQAEIDDIITKVKNANETANIELSIMMYRDKTDEYLVRYSDFTTDIESQKEFLAEQKAKNGGDFPEAVDEAMTVAMEKQWNDDATKLLIHVADAPSHDADVPRWNTAVLNAASKGIKILSVGCSGINKATEYLFRCQSLITGGQYIYLTDDSGIGNSHVEASSEHTVTIEYLNSCLVRLINGYFKGIHINPVPYHQDAKA